MFTLVDGLASSSAVLLTVLVFLASNKKISFVQDKPNLSVPAVCLALFSLLSLKAGIAGLLVTSLVLLKSKKRDETGRDLIR